jgi:NitT/TauT family transport system permease protein
VCSSDLKIAIIIIGTLFQQVLVVANTVRKVDGGLLEAAQTLGAKRRHLVLRVLVPASLPDLYNDLRILLGWAWTYLIVAEVIGVSSGITFFINQQAKYRNFDNVYAAIIIIGIIGLSTDQVLAWLGRHIFMWKDPKPSRVRAFFFFIKNADGLLAPSKEIQRRRLMAACAERGLAFPAPVDENPAPSSTTRRRPTRPEPNDESS